MSPERKEYYAQKQRRMAFYIVESNAENEDKPPLVSAVLGSEPLYFSFGSGVRVNRDSQNNKNRNNKSSIPNNKRFNQIQCPSLPIQWRNNLDVPVPEAVFDQLYQ